MRSLPGKQGTITILSLSFPALETGLNACSKAVNRPEKGSAVDMVFAWLDTREARPLESKAYALLNDNGRPVKADVTDAFRS
jgi:hypothetical protein